VKTIAENLYAGGKKRRLITRVRIPSDLRAAYPGRLHVQKALGTSDIVEGKGLHHVQMAAIYSDFEVKRAKLRLDKAERLARASSRLTALSADQVGSLAQHFVHQSLLTDDHIRSQGLDDDDFESLGEGLLAQRAALGSLLARGRVECIVPALRSFMHLMGTEAELAPEDERRVGLSFLQSVVQSLDLRIARHNGNSVASSSCAPAHTIEAVQEGFRAAANVGAKTNANPAVEQTPNVVSWDSLFEKWRQFVKDRPSATTIAMKTAWRDLQRVAADHGVLSPRGVTPHTMKAFVDAMRARELKAETLNDRLGKVKHVFSLAVGYLDLPSNPAADTIGQGQSSLEKRQKPQRSFLAEQLQAVFTSGIFDGRHLRSAGKSGEAAYWIPLIMCHSGLRPEEVGGLATDDIVADGRGGYYFDVADRPDGDDAELFEGIKDDIDDGAAESAPLLVGGLPSRTLKNGASVRRVPVAQALIDIGLFRYRDWLMAQGHRALFPKLKKDCHGKLTGAFGKFFGRYKREIGIEDARKTLYSFRHCMKNFLEQARVPTKYLKRTLGHTSGDGAVTDGYGDDMPFEVLAEHFSRVRFPTLPVMPWAPGKGFLSFPNLASKRPKREPREPRLK